MRADALTRRRRILTAARDLIAEHGQALPLDLIAQTANVGIATLYRNFPDRQALVTAVMLDLVADIEQAVADAAVVTEASPDDAWESLVRRLVGLRVGPLTDALGGPGSRSLPVGVKAAQRRALAALADVLSPLVRSGAVRADLTAQELVAAVGILSRPQPDALRDAAPDVVDHLVDAFLAWSRVPQSERR